MSISSEIRDCILKINKKQDIENLLPEYVRQSMELHDEYARIRLMMEYYLFYEVVSEGINPYIETAQETIDRLNRIIETVWKNGLTEKECQEQMEALSGLRQEVMERMQVLTGYVDCFVIYEYILNRIQYRFEDLEVLPEDTVFAQEVLNFIFGSQDNVAINDNLHFVLGQLPMRMTRKHYFDLIKDCISVYQGSDVSALEGFLYMFRTSAMLYRDAGQEKYFTEFIPVLKELAELDYENMDHDLYEIYAEKIRVSASKLTDLSDLYVQIGQIINEVYTVTAAAPYTGFGEKMPEADMMIRGMNALFLEKEDAVWQQAGEEPETEEEKLEWLQGFLMAAEGRQEKLYDAVTVAEAALDEMAEAQADEIRRQGLNEGFEYLRQLSLLNSDSVFAGLDQEKESGKVTPQMAEKVTEELLAELREAFSGSSRMVRRAIMSNTIEKLPTFFSSAQEVADYIIHSLNQCEDEAEKYASKQLILEMIQ